MRTLILTLAVGFLAAGMAVAQDCCEEPACCEDVSACAPKVSCNRCGVQKACQIVCEMKKVKRIVWAVECEEFCVPLPKLDCGVCGSRGCGGCGSTGRGGCAADDCGGCGEDPCAALQSRRVVPPKCGKVRTRKKLVKKEITCEIPIYKCVVVDACGACGEGCGEEAEAAVPAEASLEIAPLPPRPSPRQSTRIIHPPLVIGTSYFEELKFDR